MSLKGFWFTPLVGVDSEALVVSDIAFVSWSLSKS